MDPTDPIVASTLHQLADQLNEELRAASKYLRDLGLGVTAEIPLATGRLGFVKLGDIGFQLAYLGDVVDKWIPITSASREVRLQAAEKLFEMEQALRAGVASEIQRTTSAIESVRRFLHRG